MNLMKGSIAALALLSSIAATSAQTSPPAHSNFFVCPATITIGAVTDATTAGWTSLANASATFKKAEVSDSVGLTAPMLTCEYSAGTTADAARVGRPEPAGMLCTVNAMKAAQFDCFPRPGAAPAAQH